MASTRAKARALRDMCNVGITTLEELADFDDVIGPGQSKKAARKKAVGKTDKKEPKAKTAPKKKALAKDEQKPKAKEKQPKAAEKVEPKAAEKVEPNGESDDKGKSDQPKRSDAQIRAIYNLSRRRGISVEELEAMAMDAYGVELENLTTTDASTFIRQLQQAA